MREKAPATAWLPRKLPPFPSLLQIVYYYCLGCRPLSWSSPQPSLWCHIIWPRNNISFHVRTDPTSLCRCSELGFLPHIRASIGQCTWAPVDAFLRGVARTLLHNMGKIRRPQHHWRRTAQTSHVGTLFSQGIRQRGRQLELFRQSGWEDIP